MAHLTPTLRRTLTATPRRLQVPTALQGISGHVAWAELSSYLFFAAVLGCTFLV